MYRLRRQEEASMRFEPGPTIREAREGIRDTVGGTK
jgi:hypothetical protein